MTMPFHGIAGLGLCGKIFFAVWPLNCQTQKHNEPESGDESFCKTTYDASKAPSKAPSTVSASCNAIGPERHVIVEGYQLVM